MAEPNKHWFDPFYKWRYGVTSDEKHDIAMRGAVPGGVDVRSSSDPAELDLAERKAAGYLFGKQHPYIGQIGTQIANALRFTEDPKLHEAAMASTQAGVRDAFDEQDEQEAKAAAYQQKKPNPLSTSSIRVNSPTVPSGY